MNILKTAFLIIAFMLVSNINSFAQDDKLDSLSFEVTPVKEEKPPYFALGGGYTGTFLLLKMDDLNAHLKANNFGMSDLKSSMYMSGVQGFTAIGIVPNLRIGFFGMSGTQTSENNVGDTITGVDFSLSYTGFALDYGIILGKSIAILPGISAGWVKATIESYRSKNTAEWVAFKPESANMYRAEKSAYFIQPNINLEYALTPFLMARVNAGYSMSFSGDWKYNNTGTLSNVPKGINANGLTLQFGVFVGLFNY